MHDDNRPAVLLLSRDRDWSAAAWREASALPAVRLLAVDAARDAVALLCRGERFSHLLIHPSAADGLLPDLIGLTAGEAESGIVVVLLGEICPQARWMHDAGRAVTVPHPTPGWLGQAMAMSTPEADQLVAEVPLADLLAALEGGRLQFARSQQGSGGAEVQGVGLQEPGGFRAQGAGHPEQGAVPELRGGPAQEAGGKAGGDQPRAGRV